MFVCISGPFTKLGTGFHAVPKSELGQEVSERNTAKSPEVDHHALTCSQKSSHVQFEESSTSSHHSIYYMLYFTLWIHIPSERVIGDLYDIMIGLEGPVVPNLRYGGHGSEECRDPRIATWLFPSTSGRSKVVFTEPKDE